MDEAALLEGAGALALGPVLASYAGSLARLHGARPAPALRARMQLLVSMAGMLQSRLPSDVFARLISLASSMV